MLVLLCTSRIVDRKGQLRKIKHNQISSVSQEEKFLPDLPGSKLPSELGGVNQMTAHGAALLPLMQSYTREHYSW